MQSTSPSPEMWISCIQSTHVTSLRSVKGRCMEDPMAASLIWDLCCHFASSEKEIILMTCIINKFPPYNIIAKNKGKPLILYYLLSNKWISCEIPHENTLIRASASAHRSFDIILIKLLRVLVHLSEQLCCPRGISSLRCNENVYRIPGQARNEPGCTHTDTRSCGVAHTWVHDTWGPYLWQPLPEMRIERVTCKDTLSNHQPWPSGPANLAREAGWKGGRSEVAGSGWVKWPQLDLQCQHEFLFLLFSFVFCRLFYWGRNHLNGWCWSLCW